MERFPTERAQEPMTREPARSRLPRRRRPDLFAVLLVAAGTLAASFTLLVARAPNDASAYYQSYNCESFVGRATCSLTAGSWSTLTNVGASNYNVAGDICAQFGGTSLPVSCTLGGYSIVYCGNSPVWSYGISETWYGDNDNISGHEDNYTNSCS